MNLASTILSVLLMFLAVSSGVTKIALMDQEVDLFGRYGFSTPILVVFGATQLIGGFLLPFEKTRFHGAAVVAITFVVSLVVLLMDGNVPVSIATVGATLLVGIVMKQSWRPEPSDS